MITSIKTLCKHSHPLWFSRLGLQHRLGVTAPPSMTLWGALASPPPRLPAPWPAAPVPVLSAFQGGWWSGTTCRACFHPLPPPQRETHSGRERFLKPGVPHGDARGESCSESAFQPRVLNPRWAATLGELGVGAGSWAEAESLRHRESANRRGPSGFSGCNLLYWRALVARPVHVFPHTEG